MRFQIFSVPLMLHEDIVKEVKKIWTYLRGTTFDHGAKIGYRGLLDRRFREKKESKWNPKASRQILSLPERGTCLAAFPSLNFFRISAERVG
jgi:hypothetical protein